MQNKIYSEDLGINFGKWSDETSKLIYFDSTIEILKLIDLPKKIADFGGANGILKKMIPNIITIDIDGSKNPDVVDDILVHSGNYELIIIRFVIHYLNDYELIQLFENIKSFHSGKILLIQFVNDDLLTKYKNSKNEFKFFRTEEQLEKLIPIHKKIYSIEYKCSSEFYKNRLGLNDSIEHLERINAYLIEF